MCGGEVWRERAAGPGLKSRRKAEDGSLIIKGPEFRDREAGTPPWDSCKVGMRGRAKLEMAPGKMALP